MAQSDPRVTEFSTEEIPEPDRIAYWREHYGHIMLRVDLEPKTGAVFQARNRALSLPGLQLLDGSSSPVRVSRRGEYLADGNDDVVLVINRMGSIAIESGGREQSLREGEAIVLCGGEPFSFNRQSLGRSFSLRVPRRLFEETVVSIDDALMRPIGSDQRALKLLENYVSWLLNSEGGIDSQLLHLSIRHVHDLLALTVGPAADFAETARTRGVRAARLKLAKTYIASRCHQRDITVRSIAVDLKVTPRYLQRLFEAHGTTFSEFLVRQRLALAHRLLCDPTAVRTSISCIAYDVGFGDLSYFNRSFRRQYGLTPREVRGDKARP